MPLITGYSYLNDELYGTIADDEMRGLEGDSLRGGGGNDTLIGGSGNDLLDAGQELGSARVTLDGGEGDDAIYAGSHALVGAGSQWASVTAGAGNDEINIFGDHASGVFDGGAGDDRFNVTVSVGDIDLRLGSGGVDVVTYIGYRQISPRSVLLVEQFQGEESGDVLRLGLTEILYNWDHSNPFAGGFLRMIADGGDTILQIDEDGGGDDYHDFIRFTAIAPSNFGQTNLGGYSRDGAPTVGSYVKGSDTPPAPGRWVQIDGTVGGDTLIGGAANDLVSAGAGNDLISTGSGNDQISSYYGDDTVSAGSGDDRITDESGANRLSGDDGDDTIVGGDSNEVLIGGAGADRLTGGGGADVFLFAPGDSGVAGGRVDVITDWSSNDVLAIGGGLSAGALRVASAADFSAALFIGSGVIATGTWDYVAVTVGPDLIVFVDSAQNNGAAEDAIILAGRTLADFGVGNILSASAGAGPLPKVALPNLPTDGPDSLVAHAGASEIHAGAGDDTILGSSVTSYLRGDDGNDKITGGSAFDDINGNMGDDQASGGLGDDWVVGGKGNDYLSGEGGNDLVYGNLGDDVCDGGEGDDIIRGGQGNDILYGGHGADFLSGDRGDDQVSGGAGADIFHSFGDAGLDTVYDFRQAEGDRVMLDPGTQYTVSQVGSDTVVDMVGGGKVVLYGVTLSTLTPGWIFVG